jgi:hypothetical protein
MVVVDAEAFSLEAAEAAEAAEDVATPAGFGHHLGDGSTAAGVRLLRLRYLPSRRSNPRKQQRLWERVTGTSSSHEPNKVRRLRHTESRNR